MFQQPASSILTNKEVNSTNIILINQQSTNQVTNENDIQFPISKSRECEAKFVENEAQDKNSFKNLLNESKFIYKTPCNTSRKYEETLVKKYFFYI